MIDLLRVRNRKMRRALLSGGLTMAVDTQLQQTRRGTRRLMLWGTLVPAIFLIALMVWRFAAPPSVDANRMEQADQSTGSRTNQGSGESEVGKSQPQRREDPAGSKALDIQQTAKKLSLTDEQHSRVRAFLAQRPDLKRTSEANFTVSIGSRVPDQFPLAPLPHELSGMLQGYDGSDYALVGDQLVIVDHNARRVVAIIPDVG
jgi:hypothetical protein